MEELRGRTALVTGASSGIGAAIARRYAQHGMRVAVHYHKNEAGAQETRRLMAPAPEGEHLLLRADVADPAQVQQLVEAAARQLGRLDVLVNNAGIYAETPFTTPDYADWQAGWKRVLDVNLMSAVNATYCAVPVMKAQGGGKIVNVA